MENQHVGDKGKDKTNSKDKKLKRDGKGEAKAEHQGEEVTANENGTHADGSQESKEEKGNLDHKEDKKGSRDDSEDSFKSKFYYLAAEMENFKKRVDREKENLLKYGNEKILLDLIEVVDNFERTTSVLQGEEDSKIKNIVTGIDMVRKQFGHVLQKHGLVPVEAIGKIFDPHFHEAVSEKHVNGKKDQEIIEEYQKGYTLCGRLLRPAKVVVARAD